MRRLHARHLAIARWPTPLPVPFRCIVSVTGAYISCPLTDERAETLSEATNDSTEFGVTGGGGHRARLLRAFEEGRQQVQAGGWPDWSPLVQVHEPGSPFCIDVGCDYSFANSRYQVLVNFESTPGWPPTAHLKIKPHDKRCVRDWRDMQRVKNEICGTESEGVELYPAESRLVDEVNEFHIFALHPATGFPFGHQKRRTATPEESSKDSQGNPIDGERWQRRFEDHHNAEGCSPTGQIAWPKWSPGNPGG